MKSTLAVCGLMAAGALAVPLATRQSTNIDPTVLQFALTLEHLENVFYHGALQKFSLQDFINAGYSADYYNNLKYISFDEQSHVQLLSGALTAAGYTPVAACQYMFPYTDVKSFITLSSILEGVGTSAYLGGAPLITSKAYLTVAGSILVAEALHTSMQRSAVAEVPMANPYGTPLDPTSVYTLAAMFIGTCPANNTALPFVPFPTLTYSANGAGTCEEPNCAPSAQIKKRDGYNAWVAAEGNYASESSTTTTSAHSSATSSASYSEHATSSAKPSGTSTSMKSSATSSAPSSGSSSGTPPPSAGATINLVAASNVPAGSYVTFVSGLSVVSVPATINGANVSVKIPSVAAGQTYVFISKTDQEGTLVDANVLFGPAIVEVNPAPPAIDYSIY